MTDTLAPETRNGQQPAAPGRPIGLPDVPFGNVDHDDVMPFSWAERGLTWLHQERPQVFADMMLYIVGVERGSRRTAR